MNNCSLRLLAFLQIRTYTDSIVVIVSCIEILLNLVATYIGLELHNQLILRNAGLEMLSTANEFH